MKSRIWLSLAHMGGKEQNFIKEAFDTNWVVPLGPNVDGFEKDLSAYLGGERYTVALSAGTAALHLGLILLGVKTGDEVICQSFTFAATANPITYVGATPVFVDSEKETWNMSPVWLEKAIEDRILKTGRKPAVIMPVHLYGMPASMDEIMAIADRYGIPVLEDAAEALGSRYKGRYCGTFGELAVLSFNGNKMITTSGGGALVCRTEDEAKTVMFYATQARDNAPHYQHSKIGYNYRMSNICAGIGRGQMFVLDEHIWRRKKNHNLYIRLLGEMKGITFLENPSADFDSNHWLTCIVIDPLMFGHTREDVRLAMDAENIETRPLWKPMHMQPVFSEMPFYGDGVSEYLFEMGLCLPSGPSLTDGDIMRVAEVIKNMGCKKVI